MKKQLITACLYTLVTAVLVGLVYPLVITGLAKVLFADKASGQLISRNGEVIGSRILGQPFTGPGYFHSRPSAAGTGYDAANSSGSNLGPSNKTLLDRVDASVKSETDGKSAVPVDLVTASGSGLDPDLSPAAALYQVSRVAKERHLGEQALTGLVREHTLQRQFGLLGEPRVNVLELNLALDAMAAPVSR